MSRGARVQGPEPSPVPARLNAVLLDRTGVLDGVHQGIPAVWAFVPIERGREVSAYEGMVQDDQSIHEEWSTGPNDLLRRVDENQVEELAGRDAGECAHRRPRRCPWIFP